MGQLSAAGIVKIKVAPRLNACLLSTGDEVCQPGDNLQTGQIYDSNRPMLTGLLQAYGMNITQSEIVPDSCDALTKAYEKGLENCDVILSSGGASDGVEDHTQAAMRNLGVDLVFWRLAMKPGRPMAVGQKGDKFIFCLPGNPVAAFVCFKLLVMPVLDRLSGGLVRPPLKIGLTSGFHHKKRAGRAEFMRAVVINDKQGKQVVMPYGRKGAGVLSSLTGADGLVEIPLEAELIVPGDQLNFLPFKEQVL